MYPNLLKALNDNKINKSKLARELNLNRQALYNKLNGEVRFYKNEF
ncbi:MAG: helix-turn-helix transcriptional regulator [Eubacteriales bacterium]|nr:helix-turn-helix transcriptional regulator [Eubacteriales bacterium]